VALEDSFGAIFKSIVTSPFSSHAPPPLLSAALAENQQVFSILLHASGFSINDVFSARKDGRKVRFPALWAVFSRYYFFINKISQQFFRFPLPMAVLLDGLSFCSNWVPIPSLRQQHLRFDWPPLDVWLNICLCSFPNASHQRFWAPLSGLCALEIFKSWNKFWLVLRAAFLDFTSISLTIHEI
jgi:hypothetical protein